MALYKSKLEILQVGVLSKEADLQFASLYNKVTKKKETNSTKNIFKIASGIEVDYIERPERMVSKVIEQLKTILPEGDSITLYPPFESYLFESGMIKDVNVSDVGHVASYLTYNPPIDENLNPPIVSKKVELRHWVIIKVKSENIKNNITILNGEVIEND